MHHPVAVGHWKQCQMKRDSACIYNMYACNCKSGLSLSFESHMELNYTATAVTKLFFFVSKLNQQLVEIIHNIKVLSSVLRHITGIMGILIPGGFDPFDQQQK